jgi:hypothetical protein
MSKGLAIAAGLLLYAASSARAGQAIGSVPIPGSVADLAAAAGVHRVDASTLPLDIVRIAFASPDGAEETRIRAALARVLQRDGAAAGLLPLPLSPRTWTERVLGAAVADSHLAAAIFGSRSAALLYYGLMGIEPPTLGWIESNPALLDILYKHPGVSAVYARSIRIRHDRIVTPGDAADDLWAALVGADPRTPAAFVAKLWSARSGQVAGFYDAIAHLDPPHQSFAIGRAGDPDRIARARKLLDAITMLEPAWRVADHPFRRPDVDAAVLLRTVRVSDAGELAAPGSRDVWSRVFAGVAERGPLDAAWLTRKILEGGDSVARQRLDTFLFAQRALGATPPADEPALIEALIGFGRFPALMLTLEGHGLDATACAAAARAASALDARDTIALFQSGLAIVDRSRRSGTLDARQSRAAIASLVDAARSPDGAAGLLSWVRDGLLGSLSRAVPGGDAREADALVIAAMAGPASPPGPPIEWEARRFRADLASPERRRLTTLRENQKEPSIEKALASATSRNLGALAHSMTALVYADALGEPDDQPAAAGAVWRRHRFEGNHGGDTGLPVAWRMATEVFAPTGWHLAGSVLRLDLALAPLVLRRLDSTEMPAASLLPAGSRRTLALSVVLIDPRALADDTRDAIAAALSRGRARAAALATDPSGFDTAAAEAGLSEWRTNGARWALNTGAARAVADAFTMLELFRLGGGRAPAAWGTAAAPLDGCLCLQFPERTAWEEFAGRPTTGQMATLLADLLLRTADALAARRLPALLARDVSAFAMQEVLDRARPAYFDDWLPVAYAARDLSDSQFDDYVAALTVDGPLVPLPGGVR